MARGGPLRFVIVLSAVLCIAAALYYKDVTSANFDKLIDSSKSSVMLELYAPWCGHCKQLAPEFEQLGETFAKSQDVIIAQIDADKDKKLAKRFSVSGFPTLKWVPKGTDVDSAEDVDAGRTAAELLEFVNKKTGLSKKLSAAESDVLTLTTENFKAEVLNEKVDSFVMFAAPWCGHCKALKPTWEKFASLYADEENVVIGAVDCDAHGDLAAEYSVEGFPTLKFFSKDGAEVEDYSGGRELEDLVTFLNEKAGKDIAADGGVTPSGGVVQEIAEHVKTYLAATTDEERTSTISAAEKAVRELGVKAQNDFKYYTKVFSKISERGKEYISKEKDRLKKMLEAGGSLKTSQKRSFMRRINVLNVFDEL